MARGGFEPPKPLGRQIYSLLRLTASLPRRLCSSRFAEKRASFARQAESAVNAPAALHANCLDFDRCDVPCGTARNPLSVLVCGAGEGIRTPDRLITNQLLYRTELRQPRQKDICSTPRATRATLSVAWNGKGTREKGEGTTSQYFTGVRFSRSFLLTFSPSLSPCPVSLFPFLVAVPPQKARCRRQRTRSSC